VNIANRINTASRHFPHQPAIIFEGCTTTFSELRDQVQRVGCRRRLGYTVRLR